MVQNITIINMNSMNDNGKEESTKKVKGERVPHHRLPNFNAEDVSLPQNKSPGPKMLRASNSANEIKVKRVKSREMEKPVVIDKNLFKSNVGLKKEKSQGALKNVVRADAIMNIVRNKS